MRHKLYVYLPQRGDSVRILIWVFEISEDIYSTAELLQKNKRKGPGLHHLGQVAVWITHLYF